MKRKTEDFNTFWSVILLLAMCMLPVRTGASNAPNTSVLSASVPNTSILASKHDLSAGGPGTIKAATSREVCHFCHTPHRAISTAALWNHHSSTATYTPYSSSTLNAKVGQPNGVSALCLSCHDGTVALGMVGVGSTPIKMKSGVSVLTGSSNLGTDLSQDHPISFTFNSALAAKQGQLCNPATLTGYVKLDQNSQMQCTSCHDPHNDQYGKFLVMNNTGSALCTTCHNETQWAGSTHHLSTVPLTPAVAKLTVQPGAKIAPKTVGANACNNCHAPHAAAGRQQLLLTARQEQTCFACHNGTVVRKNIEPEFNKPSVHPVLQSSLLSASGKNIPTASPNVTCSDCHNPHASQTSTAPSTALATALSGAILGVKGVTPSGSIINSVTSEYELCFRCHGDNPVRVKGAVDRVTPETNLRLAFNTSNSSYHPVAGIGKSAKVPSLLPPYTAGMTIKCTDCHNNDQGPGAGGTGPRGPHGSAYAPLLERQLITAEPSTESAANYALCYKCHSRASILSDQSFSATNNLGQSFGHRFHIVTQQAACTTCHDSHGTTVNKHLINFNPDYVTLASNGRIAYVSTGIFHGNCTLTCHGANHVNASYPNVMSVSPAKPPAKLPPPLPLKK